MMSKKEEEQSMDPRVLCRKGKNYPRRRYKDKRLSRVWGKYHQRNIKNKTKQNKGLVATVMYLDKGCRPQTCLYLFNIPQDPKDVISMY